MFYLATINVSHSYIKSERLIDQYDQCGKNTVVIVSVLFVKCTVLFGFMISFCRFLVFSCKLLLLDTTSKVCFEAVVKRKCITYFELNCSSHYMRKFHRRFVASIICLFVIIFVSCFQFGYYYIIFLNVLYNYISLYHLNTELALCYYVFLFSVRLYAGF